MTDIPDGPQTEKTLRKSAERYRRITQALTDYVYTVGVRDGRVVDTEHGESCETVTGYKPDDFKANPNLWLNMVPEEDRAAVVEQAATVLSGRPAAALEHRILRKDGAVRWIRNTPVPHCECGKLVFYDGVIQDITERKLMEDEVLQAQKMEAIGLLASGVAHDFNNVLTTILGYDYLLIDGLKPGDPLAGFAGEIRRCTWLAAAVAQQMMAFSRKQISRPRIVDVNAVVIEMSRMLERLIPSDIVITQQLAPGPWPVKADLTQLQQVVLNLVINARDAMLKGGAISIATANLQVGADGGPDPRAKLGPGSYVCLAVTDTGTGMDEKVLRRLFEPFFTTKEAGRGTGLGLATVKGIVKQCQGHISVTSQVGRGSAFRIYLPRAAGGTAAMLPGPVGAEVRGGSETILLVEDHADLGALIEKVLCQKGYHVLRAARAKDALAISVKHRRRIDLLLTDIILPDMNGKELADQLAARKPGLKVVYMSGYAGTVLDQVAHLPMTHLLEKPFPPAQMLVAVRAVLDASSSQPTNPPGSDGPATP
jgi:PAS domain S-box-containing protein